MHRKRHVPASGLLRWSGMTDRGKVRTNNEDAFLGLRFDAREIQRLGRFGEASTDNHDHVFAVSDGMGGAKAGEYASQIAVEKITRLLPRAFKQSAAGLDPGFADVLAELYGQTHQALVYLGRSYEECSGMEATLSLCWFRPGWMCFGHVGDSRIYHLPADGDAVRQVSHDDTYVGWLFRNGKINEREARTHPRRNVLQKALGGGNQFVDPQVGAVACGRGDVFLICSDGLTDGLYDGQITEILRDTGAGAPMPGVADRLVAASVKASGRDNTTALMVEVC